MMTPLQKAFHRPHYVRLQIDITNKCHKACVYCTRFIRHLRKDQIFEMSLDQFEAIIDCSKDMPVSMFGIIGGDPLMHSRFPEIMEICRDKLGWGRAALFTSLDVAKSKHHKDIVRTFHYIPANLHTPEQLQSCRHHPFTLAVCDMVENPDLRRDLIDKCWIGDNWCFSASPLGFFHCEVMYGLAMLQGIKGWDIEPGWWTRGSMADQLYLCELCGGCIPMEMQVLADNRQKMSPSFLRMLLDNNCDPGDYGLVEEPLELGYMIEQSKVWRPSQYRAESVEEAEAWGNYLGGTGINWGYWEARLASKKDLQG